MTTKRKPHVRRNPHKTTKEVGQIGNRQGQTQDNECEGARARTPTNETRDKGTTQIESTTRHTPTAAVAATGTTLRILMMHQAAAHAKVANRLHTSSNGRTPRTNAAQITCKAGTDTCGKTGPGRHIQCYQSHASQEKDLQHQAND